MTCLRVKIHLCSMKGTHISEWVWQSALCSNLTWGKHKAWCFRLIFTHLLMHCAEFRQALMKGEKDGFKGLGVCITPHHPSLDVFPVFNLLSCCQGICKWIVRHLRCIHWIYDSVYTQYIKYTCKGIWISIILMIIASMPFSTKYWHIPSCISNKKQSLWQAMDLEVPSCSLPFLQIICTAFWICASIFGGCLQDVLCLSCGD